MNKLVYINVPNEFVIGQVVFKVFIKGLAVAMVNKTVALYVGKHLFLFMSRVLSTHNCINKQSCLYENILILILH
jgi:hypothetical protein